VEAIINIMSAGASARSEQFSLLW